MKHSIEEITLKNGAKGVLIDIPGASVMNTRVHFRAGMRYAKSPELYEIAHVTEHLAFGANSQFKDEQAYEAEFTKNGAYHNAWTSDFSVCYETECADFEWERILDLKRIAITEPRFNEDELKSEKGNVKSELTGYMNEYSRLIWPRLQKALGEPIPNLKERLKTVNNITLKDIKDHYRRTHTANNMSFAIAGQIKSRRKAIIKNLESWNLKPGKPFAVPKDELSSAHPVLIRRKDASNISFGFSWITPRKLNPNEVYAMGCLNHILNGTMNSRIFGQARKQGLIYGMGSTTNFTPVSSSWDFDGEVNQENAIKLFDLIREELTKILNGEIDESEIESARLYMTGRYQMGAQTVSQIIDYYAESYFQNHEIENYNNIPNMIKNINRTTMVDTAREFAANNIFALVAVGSGEKALINDLADRLKI